MAAVSFLYENFAYEVIFISLLLSYMMKVILITLSNKYPENHPVAAITSFSREKLKNLHLYAIL